jgi:acyl carrier protein
MEITEKLEELLKRFRPDTNIEKDKDLTNILDSFELLTLLIEIEEEFNVKISPEDLSGKVKNIETFTKLVESKR